MQSFKLISLIVSVIMVLGFCAILVSQPNTGSMHIADASLRQTVQDPSCIPNDTQWICQ